MTGNLDLFAPPSAPAPVRPACPVDVDRVLRGELSWMALVHDAFAFLASLPDECVDLIDTDIPYASLELHRNKGTTTRLKVSDGSTNKWFGTIANATLVLLLEEFYRVLKPDRHCYLWLDGPTTDVIKWQQFLDDPDDPSGPKRNKDGSYPTLSGFKYHRDLAWVKTTKSGEKPHGGMGYHWRGAKENVMFLEKGKRRLNDLGLTDVLWFPRPSDVDHATPKPREAQDAIVTNSSNPGEVVLDPFCGSGPAIASAVALGRRAIGCDLDPAAIETTKAAVLAAIQPVEPDLVAAT